MTKRTEYLTRRSIPIAINKRLINSTHTGEPTHLAAMSSKSSGGTASTVCNRWHVNKTHTCYMQEVLNYLQSRSVHCLALCQLLRTVHICGSSRDVTILHALINQPSATSRPLHALPMQVAPSSRWNSVLIIQVSSDTSLTSVPDPVRLQWNSRETPLILHLISSLNSRKC